MPGRIAAVVLVLLCGCAVAKSAAEIDVANKRILVVQAHADDERVIAPLLVDACQFQESTCHIVVAAMGMSMGCALAGTIKDPMQCEVRRTKEMIESAKRLSATVEFLRWQDLFYSFNAAGLERTLDEWAQAAGGHDLLVQQIAAVIARQQPNLIFALDPRHGSSCHPGHRGVARLLAEVIAKMPKDQRPQVFFEETTDLVDTPDRDRVTIWPKNRAPVAWYDGSKVLPNGAVANSYSAIVRRIHASQDKTASVVSPAPARKRMRIPFVNLNDIDPNEDLCTKLKLQRPTFDLPGNLDQLMRKDFDSP